MAFRIAQVSDTHLSREKPFFVANFARVGEAVAREQPDLVINSGDISLDGASNESDLREARRLHDAMGSPCRFIPGNHDLGDNVDVPGAHGGAITAERRARYLNHFGQDWWSLDAPGWRIVGVNAQLFASDLIAAQEQLQFIANAASDASERRFALFIHKPLCDQRVDEDVVGGRFLNPSPRRALLTAFGRAAPALIASGHVHQYRSSEVDGARHIWAPSTAYFMPDRRQPRYGLKEVGFVVHELREDGSHYSRFAAAGTQNFDISDFPEAYGPM